MATDCELARRMLARAAYHEELAARWLWLARYLSDTGPTNSAAEVTPGGASPARAEREPLHREE